MIFQGPSKSFSLDEEVQLASKKILQQSFESQETMNSESEQKTCECEALFQKLRKIKNGLHEKCKKISMEQCTQMVIFFKAILTKKRQQIIVLQKDYQNFNKNFVLFQRKVEMCRFKQIHEESLKQLKGQANKFSQLLKMYWNLYAEFISSEIMIGTIKITKQDFETEINLFLIQILNSKLPQVLTFKNKSQQETEQAKQQYLHLENKYSELLIFLEDNQYIQTKIIGEITKQFKKLSQNYTQLREKERNQQLQFTFGEK